MPLFFFNVVTSSETILDLEGEGLSDLRAARVVALANARGSMSDAILRGKNISSRRIEICSEDQTVLLVVPFSEAITEIE
jgi:hypothetical protein